MLIKSLLLVGLAVTALIGLRAPRGARHVALRRITLLLFIVGAAASVLFPELLNSAARAVGVGRGADLILYGLIVAFIVYLETSYLRLRALESDLTEIARRLALDEARTAAQLSHIEHEEAARAAVAQRSAQTEADPR